MKVYDYSGTSNKYYLFEVWLVSMFLISLGCACFPVIRLYPNDVGPESFAYHLGLFVGVVIFVAEFSIPLFVGLYLIFFLLAEKIRFSALVIKVLLMVVCLTWLYFCNRINYWGYLFHPFFITYSTLIAVTLFLYNVYQGDSFINEEERGPEFLVDHNLARIIHMHKPRFKAKVVKLGEFNYILSEIERWPLGETFEDDDLEFDCALDDALALIQEKALERKNDPDWIYPV